MHSRSQRLSFRALVSARQRGRLCRWLRPIAVILVILVVALVGGLALAQTPPPGPPGSQESPSAPGTPGGPGLPCAQAQPSTPGVQWTFKGDTAAWAEVEAARKKLLCLSGYRLRASMVVLYGSTIVSTMEFVPPNSYRIITEMTSFTFDGRTFPGNTSESVTVNGQGRGRSKSGGEPWGPWTCPKARPAADTGGASTQVTVEASRGPDTEIEGTPVRTYTYTLVTTITSPDKKERTVTTKITVYVGTQTGLPRREITGTLTMDYYDYDAKIEMALPPCEKET